jgi:hypothetical protein
MDASGAAGTLGQDARDRALPRSRRPGDDHDPAARHHGAMVQGDRRPVNASRRAEREELSGLARDRRPLRPKISLRCRERRWRRRGRDFAERREEESGGFDTTFSKY